MDQLNTLNKMTEEAQAAILGADSSKALYDLKVKYLGKQGSLTQMMKLMGKLPKEERPKFGQMVNVAKKELQAVYDNREKAIGDKELEGRIQNETIDLHLPGPESFVGSKHPLRSVIQEMTQILSRLGFSVRQGPMIEEDRYNFEALNFPKDHPARDMQDTFYIDPEHVLRTHTSPIQIRTLEKEKLPLRILAPGTVFRVDSDVTHSPNFHQVEGLLVNKQVSMAELKGVVGFFLRNFFGPKTKVRFRPSYFPFTEPSAEVDCTCPKCAGKGCRLCSNTGWIEIAGCGLVHPNVFKSVGIDPNEWEGFAFGFGVERMAMIKYGITDIRHFYNNDVRFLEQLIL